MNMDLILDVVCFALLKFHPLGLFKFLFQYLFSIFRENNVILSELLHFQTVTGSWKVSGLSKSQFILFGSLVKSVLMKLWCVCVCRPLLMCGWILKVTHFPLLLFFLIQRSQFILLSQLLSFCSTLMFSVSLSRCEDLE